MAVRFPGKIWWTLFAALFAALFVAACGSSSSDSKPALTGQQQIRHVFVITLENENYSTTFGSTPKAPYLATTLAAQGALVQQYYGTGHVSLDNYIAMLSGQSPTTDTDNDCMTYSDLKSTGTTPDGQTIGTGCVYPAAVKTLPDQLKAAGFTWKGYEGDMGNDPAREAATCGHPVIGTQDMTQVAEAPSAAVPQGDMYATRHNPFMYFHSIIDSSDCGTNVVNLNANLEKDLQSVDTTANFNFITPSLCDDGHDAPCADGRPGGLTSADAFLQEWVPKITSSPAFKKDGLLIINFDESSYAPTNGLDTTTNPPTLTLAFTGTTCCSQQPGPNLGAFPQTSDAISTVPGSALGMPSVPQVTVNLTKQSFGGDQTGAVLISPFIKPGTVSTVPYNHYSMLKSIEDIFGLSHLGYAGQAGLVGFGSDIFTNL
ncbi:alkaline phosphatase family protein [Paraburkholderia caballeronis]|uniref:Phosphoesterase family protein n=1 Tax=Paraburkholderia caballeronis TaxID=416943 RepID=A0A1H7U0U2_9BURK|nr:alkaline phosphatase family protein [Paraburkholderia caballeronis]PXW23446.1 phosphoesterase family protein [Paraburkholderia caballeronis]PXW98439.1 phosphoesterase family protein [Paraburkholderia caballeronis]RAJ95170.1 phosphoesterase family protein [Paraburkholderia caballeronis]SEC52958.1 Phosphoesterase family protein [Paraburkholderia caballeronis]SEL90563.1 Phosphoesterase family protein [Paraburkholderia caballeronis]